MPITKATASSIAPAAKGDLVVGSATNDAAVLGVGSNDQVLTADSSTATGLKWATPASGSTFAGCSLYKTSDTTVPNNTYTKVAFEAEHYDTNGYHDNSTNNTRITIPSGKAGKYLVTGVVTWSASQSTTIVALAKNNSNVTVMTQINFSSADSWAQSFNCVVDLAVGDYIELNCYQASGNNRSIYTGTTSTTFQASLLGA